MIILRYLIFLFMISNSYSAKIKNLVSIKGVRENPLIGYGLVIGLNGTGDKGTSITNASLIRMFKKLGLNPKNEATSNNVAAVVVTTKFPPFSRLGQKIDVTVSSVGNASSLGGGTLLITPLKGGDGNVYVVASGSVSIGGLIQGSRHATTALIPSGGIVEKEIGLEFNNKKSIRLLLHNSDFTTAARVQRIINRNLGGKFAIANDATTIDVMIPSHYYRKIVSLVSIIENFEVNPSQKSKIVINERTGTIVAGGEILLRNVAISHGNLTVEIKDSKDSTDGTKKSFYLMEKGSSLKDLVKALNGLGAKPEDIISIFQTLKSNGSLTGEIELI